MSAEPSSESVACCAHQRVRYNLASVFVFDGSDRWECESCGRRFYPAPLEKAKGLTFGTDLPTLSALANALAAVVDSELQGMTDIADVWLGTAIEDEEAALEESENKKLIIRDALFDALGQTAWAEDRRRQLQIDRVQAFFYLLMRDKLPTADVVELLTKGFPVPPDDDAEFVYSAKGLADYAGELARRLLG